jgi:hypothetical protein
MPSMKAFDIDDERQSGSAFYQTAITTVAIV